MNTKIETERLLLLACDREMLQQAITGNRQLASYLNVEVPERWSEFGTRPLRFALEKLDLGEEEQGWWTYLSIFKADHKLIGSCGYKGRPDERGAVEIGYEIMPKYRNRGLATELTKALVANAFSYEEVRVVEAHTLGQENASTRVLTKCGFQKLHDVKDTNHGVIWKWALKKTG